VNKTSLCTLKGCDKLPIPDRKSYWCNASLLYQPFRLDYQTYVKPRALPWAILFQPFRLKNSFREIAGGQIDAAVIRVLRFVGAHDLLGDGPA
jgi:hypothetical protein